MGKYLSKEEVDFRIKQTKLELLEDYKGKDQKHKFKCYCGKEFEANIGHVFRHNIRSCGCFHKETLHKKYQTELLGKKFGKLTVLEYSHTKRENKRSWVYWKCQCDCGNIKISHTNTLNNGFVTSCGCIRKNNILPRRKITDLTNKIFNKLHVVEYHDTLHKNNGRSYSRWKCLCQCGNTCIVKGQSLSSGHVKSCGCLSLESQEKRRINLVGQKFARLKVIRYSEKRGDRHCWYCECDCGKSCIVSTQALKRGETRSCGCYRREQVEKAQRASLLGFSQKEGRLTVVEFIGVKSQQTFWKCKCLCGKLTILNASTIITEATKSCGNCRLFRNGILTSFVALKLHQELIDYGYHTCHGWHNFKTQDNKCIDIVLLINNQKIAIEYDSGFYHKKTLQKDKIRYKSLTRQGWKILIIRSNLKLPKISTIRKRLNKLIAGSSKEIITLKDWYTHAT